MNRITIGIKANGPLRISAEDAARVRLEDHEGNAIPLPEGKSLALCRCGASSTKPFCDRSHRSIGFHDPVSGAVPQHDPESPSRTQADGGTS
ncbi:MAG: CDGSH iron-sulfur domain-containing protein [Gemmatimonadaceae bacterium]